MKMFISSVTAGTFYLGLLVVNPPFQPVQTNCNYTFEGWLCRQMGETLMMGAQPVLAQNQPNWQEWLKKNPTYTTPSQTTPAQAVQRQILVYGRSTCSLTAQLRQDLQDRKVSYQYKDVDDPAINQEFWQILKRSGIHGRVGLPVVVSGGKVFVRPSLAQLEL
uniref:Glutaredoxin n=1 Tax=Cyanothece sp. (strain PCC 7425 / ATCC 29141) TaxID=395961 RepID=B8HUL2_CYAP4